jgi:hypothetical protein
VDDRRSVFLPLRQGCNPADRTNKLIEQCTDHQQQRCGYLRDAKLGAEGVPLAPRGVVPQFSWSTSMQRLIAPVQKLDQSMRPAQWRTAIL